MIKPVKHELAKRKSSKVLRARVRYIANAEHKRHLNKIVLPSKNHECSGDEADDFIQAVERRRTTYLCRRGGKRGKRTQVKWREFNYSSEEGTVPKPDGSGMEPRLSAEEREKVEQAFLAGPFGRGSCRHGWHIDSITGRCDWHCLAGEHDELGVIWPNDGFGKGKKCLKLELERIEEDLLAELNRKRPPDRQLKTARQRHEEKRREAGKLTFAEKLAAGSWDGTPETLSEAAEQAAYVVHSQTEKSIIVHSLDFKKDPKIIPYNIPTLTRNWSKAKTKLRLKKKQKPDEPDITGPEL